MHQDPVCQSGAAVAPSRRSLHVALYQVFQIRLVQQRLEVGRGGRTGSAFAQPVQLIDELRNAVVTFGTNGQHRQTEGFAEALVIDPDPEALGLIAHVEGRHQGQAQLL